MARELQIVKQAAAVATTAIVPARTNRRIHFRAYIDGSGANGTIVLKSGTTALSPAMATTVGEQLVVQEGYTNPGEALNATMATSSATAELRVLYSYVP